MTTTMTKDHAHKLVEKMSDGATWDDFIHEVYVRETIEQGLADSKTGRTKDVSEIREKYGLSK